MVYQSVVSKVTVNLSYLALLAAICVFDSKDWNYEQQDS